MRRALPLLILVVLFAGCTNPARDPELQQLGAPPDFSVQIYVGGVPSEASPNPLRQSSQNILEANRKLRVAVGDAAQPNYFPKVVRIVGASQMAPLFTVVRDANLMIEPTSPDAEAIEAGKKTGVVYHVALSAFGQSHTYSTTPTESPPTTQLLKKLVDLRK